MFFESFPQGGVLIHDDWSTNMKVRTSVNLCPEQWRAAKDCSIQNFLLRFIIGQDDQGGTLFEEHAIHFLCDSNSTETVASCLNFEKVMEYVQKVVPYDIKVVFRWTDGTSKQYKNIGNVGEEKKLAIRHGCYILHLFFPTNWGKGKVDLLGGIVHQLYSSVIPDLKERSNDLGVVVSKFNSLYSQPGSTRSESSLSKRVFFYVSLKENQIAKKNRTTWKTLSFPSGVILFI